MIGSSSMIRTLLASWLSMVFWASRMARFDLLGAFVHDEGGFLQAEGFHRGQQQGGPLGGRQGSQAAFRVLCRRPVSPVSS